MTRHDGFHEDLSRAERVGLGSEKGFGLVFAAFFVIVGLWPMLSDSDPRWWSLALAGGFLAIAFTLPKLLQPLNQLWHRFGLILHRVVSPIILGAMFFATVTPIGLIMRLCGKDILRMRFEPNAKSYWIEREPPGPDPQTMPKQF